MITKENILFTFAVLVLFSMLLYSLFGDKGYADLNMMKKGRDSLILDNEKLEQENLQLYRAIERLDKDDVYIESIARKELGVVGKDEIVYTIENGRYERSMPAFTNESFHEIKNHEVKNRELTHQELIQ